MSSSFLQIDLPWPINYIPGICQVIALIYITPPILLFTFDVGSYLIFKLFLKPFGNYPMYTYFKQTPSEWFERTSISFNDPSSTTTSNSSSPQLLSSQTLISNSNPTTGTLRKRSSKASISKAPTTSDYDDGSGSNEDDDVSSNEDQIDSSETTSN
ncbi:hypothetical protein DFH28DRAFT_1228536 [Melampsora americana]|nr:hypothetical protein DFH28DRAFT_1228536 [Melampsora americana]